MESPAATDELVVNSGADDRRPSQNRDEDSHADRQQKSCRHSDDDSERPYYLQI